MRESIFAKCLQISQQIGIYVNRVIDRKVSWQRYTYNSSLAAIDDWARKQLKLINVIKASGGNLHEFCGRLISLCSCVALVNRTCEPFGLDNGGEKVSWQLYATNPEHWRVRPKAARMQMKNCWSAVDTCGEGWSKVRIGCFVFWNVFLRKILSERKTLRCSTPPRDSSCSFMDLQESWCSWQ